MKKICNISWAQMQSLPGKANHKDENGMEGRRIVHLQNRQRPILLVKTMSI